MVSFTFPLMLQALGIDGSYAVYAVGWRLLVGPEAAVVVAAVQPAAASAPCSCILLRVSDSAACAWNMARRCLPCALLCPLGPMPMSPLHSFPEGGIVRPAAPAQVPTSSLNTSPSLSRPCLQVLNLGAALFVARLMFETKRHSLADIRALLVRE